METFMVIFMSLGAAFMVGVIGYGLGEDRGRAAVNEAWRESLDNWQAETDRLKAKLAELRTAVTRAAEDAKEE